jgi:transposase
MVAAPALPDLSTLDADALRSLLLAKHSELIVQHEQLLSNTSEIEHLKLVIAKLRRMIFGAKSERVEREIEQLELKLEELETVRAERAVAQRTSLNDNAAKPSRRPLPEHLPREVHTHMPTAHACPECGGELRKFGDDVSEMLEYVPSSFKVVRHVRPKLSCRSCEKVVEAEAPSRPIDRGIPGPGLLAHVLVAKYADHLPLYRQSEIYAREGVDLDRSTLADWVGAASKLLRPLVNEVSRHVTAAAKLHADDTPVPVLAPGHGKTRTGRLWTYVRDDRPANDATPPAVWFAYTPDRKGEHPRRHLSNFSGTLQADAYAGFHHLYDTGRIREAACWAHVRRKFYDIETAHHSPIAAEAIERIAALYVVESGIRDKPPKLRCEIRQWQSKPLLDELRGWFEKMLATLSRKSETALAIRYALSRWTALTRYLEDGRVEIDNNAAERSLRAVCLGRKNFLFAGSDDGGDRAAAIYTLTGTAKLNGLDPELYLRQVLERIADHPISRIAELLPWNLATVTEPETLRPTLK